MKRRQLLKAAASIPLLSRMEWLRLADARAEHGTSNQAFSRVRPGDATWPSEESWTKLGHAVEGRLIQVNSPVSACREAPDSRRAMKSSRRCETRTTSVIMRD